MGAQIIKPTSSLYKHLDDIKDALIIERMNKRINKSKKEVIDIGNELNVSFTTIYRIYRDSIVELETYGF